MQIFITVSINKVSQIYQIELGFEDVHGYIYRINYDPDLHVC